MTRHAVAFAANKSVSVSPNPNGVTTPMPHNLHVLTRPPKTLTAREQEALLRTTGAYVAGWRDHLLFALALGTGLREHELLALDVGDVVDADGKVRRRVRLRVFKRSNDDASMQEVVLSDRLRGKVEKYLAQRRHRGEVLGAETPLFVSRLGRRLSARQARTAFARWQDRAGFERRLHFHSLRHSACSSIYRATRDIRLTQRFARHRSVLSTAIYTHPSDEDLVRAVDGLPC